jgi:hypothetical protein
MKKNYLEDLENLGIYEIAFKNWCKDYEDLVYQKFEEYCNSFEVYFDLNGNVTWEDNEFVSETSDENEPKFSLNELNSVATDKALQEWLYSYSDIAYEAFESYAKAFKLYFDDNGNVLGEDE